MKSKKKSERSFVLFGQCFHDANCTQSYTHGDNKVQKEIIIINKFHARSKTRAEKKFCAYTSSNKSMPICDIKLPLQLPFRHTHIHTPNIELKKKESVTQHNTSTTKPTKKDERTNEKKIEKKRFTEYQKLSARRGGEIVAICCCFLCARGAVRAVFCFVGQPIVIIIVIISYLLHIY